LPKTSLLIMSATCFNLKRFTRFDSPSTMSKIELSQHSKTKKHTKFEVGISPQKIPKLFPNRKVRTVRTEQLCHSPLEIRLRNDLYCVKWGVKLYSLSTHPQKINQTPPPPSSTNLQCVPFINPLSSHFAILEDHGGEQKATWVISYSHSE